MAPPSAAPAYDAHDAAEEDEMEQQLRDHTVLAYNQFVRSFHRKTDELIAANRVSIDLHLHKRDAVRLSYPTMLSVERLAAWHSVARVQTAETSTMPNRVRKTARSDVRTSNESLSVTAQAAVLPRVPPVPSSTMWTALSKNYDVEDEPELKHKPYFGDDDDEDVVSEYYQLNRLQGTSTCEVDFTKQLCEAVLKQLQDTWDMTSPDLKLVAKTIQVEEKVVMEVHKMLQNAPKTAKRAKQKRSRDIEPPATPMSTTSSSAGTPLANQSPGELHLKRYEAAMDSYRLIFCRRCYVYDCEYHALDPQDRPKLEVTERNAISELGKSKRNGAGGMARNCGNQCFLGQTESSARLSKSRLLSSAMSWDEKERVACIRAYLVCAGRFCDMAKILGGKTCLEVAEYCEFNDINDHTMALERKTRPQTRRPSKKSKKNKYRPSIAHLQEIESKERDIIPTVITPCAHLGPCDDTAKCACFEHGRFCSKLCACVHDECKIFYNGCRCLRGRCRTKACPCFANGRECDLDLCTVCCDDQHQVLLAECGEAAVSQAPVDPKNDTSCQNRNMGMCKRKHVRVGRSTMEDAGWGLFVDDFVAKDEFIIEYIGEMVTQEEAERRGVVYDKLNRSYLFNLDSDTVIDATRKGNKTRFINHSSTPNCYTKVININSDYRIGIYAGRNIEPHTELFFDYGYEKEMQHARLHKQPTITTWMKKHPPK